ncbi:MAG: hypothetical protein A3E82_00905 [Gammaproteobacteria bacterium RIFCSPHIGHO2_12_FULL_38_11]|nr:MAG: hypothetical protein A3E82_00905 [Gammaproteobacteria bacterium RIFCSPHIGHO2_12_FULL_38_11]
MIVLIRNLIKFCIVNPFLVFLMLIPSVIFAKSPENMNSVVGCWQTVDAKTHELSSIIEIKPSGKYFIGTIVKTYPQPGEKPSLCKHCKGDDKNKPTLGLTIIKNMICTPSYCSHGTILDPRHGSVYHATMQLIKGGEFIKVRGYIGIPLLGRTVVWHRVSLPK